MGKMTPNEAVRLLRWIAANMDAWAGDLPERDPEEAEEIKAEAQRENARKAGAVKSEAKAQAARENGKLGGRPRKTADTVKEAK